MIKTYQVEIEFLEKVLGSTPKDAEIFQNFVAGKYAELTEDKEAEELASLENLGERGFTGFHKTEDGNPLFYDYVVKGFFKAACGALRRVEGTLSSKVRAYKKIINELIFIEPRKMLLILPEGGVLGILERPLRASTPQGERVALAKSETVPAGTKMSFIMKVFETKQLPEGIIEEWLEYGQFSGLGQWRNAGHGKFKATITEVTDA